MSASRHTAASSLAASAHQITHESREEPHFRGGAKARGASSTFAAGPAAKTTANTSLGAEADCGPSPPLFPTGASIRGVPGWRDTVEYRAAWDLEVWKALQAERFRRQLEKHKKTALRELNKRLRRQEEEALAAASRRSEAITVREAAAAKEAQRLEEQKRRVTDAEKEMARSRQHLQEAQKRVEEEIRVQVRRANEDFAHKSQLLRDQLKASESQTQRLEERLRQSEADYLHLFEEFHRFRVDHAGGGASGNCTEVNSLVEVLRSRHAEEMRLLQEKLEQRAAHEQAQLQLRCQTLEEHNTRLTAALARRREQLRLTTPNAGGAPASGAGQRGVGTSTLDNPAAGDACPPPDIMAAAVELERLRGERRRLVKESGRALESGDPVIDRMDERIRDLEAECGNRAVRS